MKPWRRMLAFGSVMAPSSFYKIASFLKMKGEVNRPSVWYTTTDGNPVSYIKLFPKDLVRLMSRVPTLDFDSVC